MSELVLPRGFQCAGLVAGIKQTPDRRDLALFVSQDPACAVAVFTQNRVVGAPVTISRTRVPRETTRAVIINSGNANACTGQRGLEDARWMTEQVAGQLGCAADDVLVCSTGIIGHFLPRPALEAGIPRAVQMLSDTPGAFREAAEGMMTTDTYPKLAACRVPLPDGPAVQVSGCAKGAAMIAPNMATMLAVIMTDAALTTDAAAQLLRHAVDRSFNCISVDGHTSTSDTVILLANGAAQPDASTAGAIESTRAALQSAVDDVCSQLAQDIIRDGEGAEHLVTLDVLGLPSRSDAYRIAKTVAESALVKTAITGADPNWGRIVSAAGYAGVPFEEQDVSLQINGTTIYKAGVPLEYDAAAVSEQMRTERDVHIRLEFTRGSAAVRFWTTDLTAEYVRLNSEYTT